ncbi:DNA mismatch repair protein MutS [Desulfocurvibacter africanus]|uniref:DNA mismatch repair protein MutS n=1 Tax=Desulfocurvibacter africanus subsp. africanus str. Walvis Bay TaxID=690850 RepID=F3Z2K6_DESAF|nr:DNA mismatch repair protein MutS [Desulfocurvibacter africanus]EGJ51339.1 DNA mismatch repair protein mutS [Desulfocurvibacter africanus subsp. africanus str. Walvis Bay]
MSSAPKLTPMFEQYLGIKQEYPDALLFYRMGDFYEVFFEDAQIAARELQIALTSRNPNSETKVPMCGVPHHSVDGYLTQLLEKGYRVAICDQVEDPKQAKGLVRRAVTRVLTPGTVIEDANLASKSHNYLAALWWDADKGAGALAWVDFSTGEWSGLASRRAEILWQWTAKLGPRELLLPLGHEVLPHYAEAAKQVNRLPALPAFDLAAARRELPKVLGVADLSVLDLEDKPELARCCGALLCYLRQTQRHDELGHLGAFRPLNLGDHLILDEVTERNLELFRRLDGKTGRGTLRHVLDETMTAMGGRLLESRLRQPWRMLAPILATQEAVAWLFAEDEQRGRLRMALERVYDLERLSTRVFLGRAAPKDYLALRESLAVLPEVRQALVSTGGDLPTEAAKILSAWDDLEDIRDLLNRALSDNPPPVITEGGLFKPGFDSELDELLELSEHGEAKLKELLEVEQRENDLPKLRLGYNRVFGYYLELSKAAHDRAPEHFIRRQTLANAERYVTPALKELEEKILSAAEILKSLEYKLFQKLRETVAKARPRFMVMAEALATLDYWQSMAEVARRNEWLRPRLHEGLELRIRGGRHPVVEQVQGRGNFIPNDLRLDEFCRLMLITGPNMAGKSTILRQSAIICIMAQMGSYVPASEADIGLVDRVFSRVGASDNLAQGQSTFMVEMMETARILRQATMRSLVILDEIGRGTSTFDGLALAWAVVEEFARRGKGAIRTLFATHYHELTALEGRIPGVRNYTVAIKEWKGDIIFLRRLVPGPSDRSYGIEVARLAGVPDSVVRRAREILSELERAKSGDATVSPRTLSCQTLLPGMGGKPSKVTATAKAAEHPLIQELREIKVDRLTPLEALNLLQTWKNRIDEESGS